MFGRSSLFANDPFFSHDPMSEFESMDRMMSEFHSGFGFPSIMGRVPDRRSQGTIMPFGGGMFGRDLFSDMNAMMTQMQSNPGAHTYSSSSVMSYSNTGDGAPKYYEAVSEATQGPDGVRQTRRSERNSETGLHKMAIGHHIYDRGHVVERRLNQRTNEREELQDFINLDEADKDAFHQEWKEKARPSHRLHNAIGADRTRDHHRHEPRALTSAEYDRQNLGRSRRRHHEDRNDGDRGSRHVRLNNHPEEI